MALLTIPNVFVNGTGPTNIIDATLMNSNFTAVATALNNLYPSQVLPLTSGQATFGATATGVGYKFLANDATAVPLTISGVSGQSADIFDVTLTNGGTKAFSVASNGAVNVNSSLAVTGNTTVTALYLNGTTAAANILDDGTNTIYRAYATGGIHLFETAGGVELAQIGPNSSQFIGSLIASTTLGITPGQSNGDIVAQRNASTGQIWIGGSTGALGMDYNVSATTALSLFRSGSASGYCPVFGGLYTNSSDAQFKENVAPITGALATLAQLRPSSYNWKEDGQPDFGFIAQDVETILPQIVRTTAARVAEDGTETTPSSKGIVYTGLQAWSISAINELNAKFDAYVAAHP